MFFSDLKLKTLFGKSAPSQFVLEPMATDRWDRRSHWSVKAKTNLVVWNRRNLELSKFSKNIFVAVILILISYY